MHAQHHDWVSLEDAVEDALTASRPGDTLVICRDSAGSCRHGERCAMCAHITVGRKTRLPQVLAQIQKFGRA